MVRVTMPRTVLRIVTYNIHGGEGTDGVIDLARLARVIGSTRPDAVALQEVDVHTARSGGVDQAAELGRLTGMHHAFGKAMGYDGGEYGEAILSRFPLAGVRVHALDGTVDYEPRAMLEATLDVGSGLAPSFLATHLDHKADEERMRQIATIMALTRRGDRPTILAGDFNAVPGSPPVAALRRSWTDASGEPGEPTFPSPAPTVKIDYVFVTPATAFRVVETKVVEDAAASDHRPVLAVLEIT